ncbi:MAG TPA: cytochrome P460 family protein [Terriglobia bacterium]|nr:cytochrome P460 family protein [Terriglobia bacterium]
MTSRTKILLMVFVGAAVGLGTLVAQAQKKPALAYPAYPNDPRHWRHTRTMVIFSKENKLFDMFAGLHNIYVNDIAWPSLKDRRAYADGSMFAMELFNISTPQGAIEPRGMKARYLMKKNAKLYPDTGGWGFEVFQDDQVAGSVKDMKKECFSCHVTQKSTDYVYVSYMQ